MFKILHDTTNEMIEEADPNCPKLQKYVSAELLRLTGIEIRVVTEW